MKTHGCARIDEVDCNFIGKSQTKFLFVTFMLFIFENVMTSLTQCFATYICPEKTIFSTIYFLLEEISQILKQRLPFEKMLPKDWHIDLRMNK